MRQLFNTIRQLVAEEKYVVRQHASERLEERGIMEWQAVAGLEDGELIGERPSATPNPAVEVRQSLPDGTDSMLFGHIYDKVVSPNWWPSISLTKVSPCEYPESEGLAFEWDQRQGKCEQAWRHL